MNTLPHIAISQADPQRGFDAFFALRLESIGVSEINGVSVREHAVRILGRQVDFIAMLPGLGEGNMIELCFVSHPSPSAPARGRIDVLLRIRVSDNDEQAMRRQAESLYNSLWPNLASISDAYSWMPITDEKMYRQLFISDDQPPYLAELVRREAFIRLDNIELFPPKTSIGFSASRPGAPSEKQEPSVYFCFPYVRNYDNLERLFNILLLQPTSVTVSIALLPTNLTQVELDFLTDQVEQCERYMQLPMNGGVSNPSEFTPPLRTQARLVLDSLLDSLNTLRDDCFVLKLHVASAQPVPGALMEAIGVMATEHVSSGDADSDAGMDRQLLAGGYDWLRHTPGNINLERLDHTSCGDSIAPAPANRLRYLVNPRQANAAFRFPIPCPTDFPGLDTRLARTVPPPAALPDEGLLIGENLYRGMIQPVRMLARDRHQHMYCVGQTGTGKSTLLLNMIMQDIRNGEGVGLLDPHGELVDQVLRRIPAARIGDVVYINPENQTSVVGLNLLEVRDELDRDSAVNHLLEIFEKLYNMREAGGPMFEMYLRNAALLAMSDWDRPATISDIMRLFLDKDFRKSKLDGCADAMVRDFWKEVAEKTQWKDYSLVDMGAYVNSKFSRFLYNHLMRSIVLQRQSSIDFLDIMNSGKIVLVDLCKGDLGETNSAFLGMILLSLIQRAAFARTSSSATGTHRDFYLYIDEFQNLATEGLISMLSEARKYHLNLVLANQYLHQIPENIREAVTGNVGTILSFRSGMKDAVELENNFLPVINRNDLTSLPNYQAYMTTLIRGSATKPFSLRTRLDETSEDMSIVEQIIRHASTYARPAAEVNQEIADYWKVTS